MTDIFVSAFTIIFVHSKCIGMSGLFQLSSIDSCCDCVRLINTKHTQTRSHIHTYRRTGWLTHAWNSMFIPMNQLSDCIHRCSDIELISELDTHLFLLLRRRCRRRWWRRRSNHSYSFCAHYDGATAAQWRRRIYDKFIQGCWAIATIDNRTLNEKNKINDIHIFRHYWSFMTANSGT